MSFLMKAEVAYQVAKELSSQELERLLSMLEVDVAKLYSPNSVKKNKSKDLTDQESISHLLKNVFKCNQ